MLLPSWLEPAREDLRPSDTFMRRCTFKMRLAGNRALSIAASIWKRKTQWLLAARKSSGPSCPRYPLEPGRFISLGLIELRNAEEREELALLWQGHSMVTWSLHKSYDLREQSREHFLSSLHFLAQRQGAAHPQRSSVFWL
jgi:hypothetical protein